MVGRFDQEFQNILDLADNAVTGIQPEHDTWVHCTDFLSRLVRIH